MSHTTKNDHQPSALDCDSLSTSSGSTGDQQCDRCNRKNKMSWHLIAETNEWICSWCYGKLVRTSRIDRKLRKSSQGK